MSYTDYNIRMFLLGIIILLNTDLMSGKTENKIIINNATLSLSSPLKSLSILDTMTIPNNINIIKRELIEEKCCLSLISELKDSSSIDSFIQEIPQYIPSLAEYSIKSLIRTGDKKKALTTGEKLKSVIDKMGKTRNKHDFTDRINCHYFALLAYLYKINSMDNEASYYYQKYSSTNFSKTIQGKCWANPYLQETGKYETILSNNNDFCMVILKDDTVNNLYANILSQNYLALYHNNNIQKAYVISKRLTKINEMIKKRHSMVIPAYYENEKNNIPGKKFIQIILFITGTFSVIFFSLKYRKWDRHRKGTNERYKKTTQYTLPLTPKDEKSLYIIFKDYVKDKQLFLNPELDRDFYAALMKVDKNRFAQIIKNHANTNLKGFLNSLRLEYAVGLMKMNKDYSLETIAIESGITSVSTFYRLFKKKYRIGPQEFRKRI